MNTGSGSFKQLDELLDQAYALDGEARSSFVEQLPEPQRGHIQKLLELSHELTVSDIARDAQAVIENIDRLGSDSGNEGDRVRESNRGAAGRWRLHRELGSGGMGQVFFATREALENDSGASGDYVQEAAIKILWAQRATSETRARFLRERRILASLNHPGLARFIDGGFLKDSRPWFAMEYVEGIDIDEYAMSLSIDARLMLFVEVCASVAYAHQRLIVHRDIKPQNILVDRSGHPRLLDFGVASVLDDIDDGIHTQSSGTPLTLQYASPEQVSGALVTVASDIYQLGLLLYKLLTGTVPYELKDIALRKALLVICEQTPPKPSVHNAKIPADMDAIVMTALNKDPDERYRTVTTFAEDVQRFIDGRPVHAVPQTRSYVTRRFLRRHAIIASIVGFSALALTAATIVSVRMAKEASAQATRSAAAQQILTDVFQKADPFAGQGATVTLADALTRAQPDIAVRVANDPLLAWEVNLALGQIYESVGLVEQEMSAYRAMLEAASALGDANGRYFLTGVAGLGSALARTNPVKAVQYFDENMPTRPRSEDDLEAWLGAQYSYVGALNRVREYGRADAGTFVMADVMDEYGVSNARTRGRLSQLLAGAARRADDLDAENRHWQDAVEHMRAANNPSALAVILSNWAIHLGRQKRYDESESAFLESMAIFERAGLEDPTFAAVIRSYAGLLFRTGRIDEAIAATERSLTLLAPSSQFYARFVGELNLVRYTFVKGDVGKSLDTLTRSLPAAQKAFADDPAVPQRMLRSFAKVLVFGRAHSSAATALGHEIRACGSEKQLLAVLETLEHPVDRDARNAIWVALNALLQKQRASTLSQADIDGFVGFYENTAPAFFDALDQWRVLDQLASLAAPLLLPSEQAQRYQTLSAERLSAEALISAQYAPEVDAIAGYLGETAGDEHQCPQPPPAPD